MRDPDSPFEVVVDACSTGIGAVLLQQDRPIAFAGRQLNPAETRYHTTDQELLAVMFALQQWQCYLQGAKHDFLLVTDHHPNINSGTRPSLSKRQARWSEKLQKCQFSWQYRPGKKNVADPVSRAPNLQPATAAICCSLQADAAALLFDWRQQQLGMCTGLAAAITDNSTGPLVRALDACECPVHTLAAATRSKTGAASQPLTKAAGSRKVAAQSGPTSAPVATGSRRVAAPAPAPSIYAEHEAVQLSLLPVLHEAYRADALLGDPDDIALSHQHMQARNGLWFKDDRLVVPDCPAIKRDIMNELHDSEYAGHGGEAKTVELIRRYFWWSSLVRDTRQFAKGCALCHGNKTLPRQYAGKLQ